MGSEVAPIVVPSRADQLLSRLVAPGALLGGRYRPNHILGQGGMGLVVHAIDTRLDREVAIKWLLPDLARDEALVARFASEATALAKIHHPNVVQILDVPDVDADATYYVMEFVPGVPLARQIREAPLPWAQAYDVLLQTANALAAVHRAGLVHRDVKPSNLLCALVAPETWHVKVIDFGIARTVGTPRLTLPGEMLGTAPYMAPEQFAGLEGDRRTDVYGWGVLALELLGRVSPASMFGSESLAGAPLRDGAAAVLDRAHVQPRIAAIVRRCLATQPDDRWQDMDAVTSQLRALDDGGSPTLIFQRAQPTPRGATLVPVYNDATGVAYPLPREENEIAATDEQAEFVDAPHVEGQTRSSVRREPPKPSRWLMWSIGGVAAAAVVIGGIAVTRVLGAKPARLEDPVLDEWPVIEAMPSEITATPAAVHTPVPMEPPIDEVPPVATDETTRRADAPPTVRRKPAPAPSPRPVDLPGVVDLEPSDPAEEPAAEPERGKSGKPKKPKHERPAGLKDPFG